MDPDSKSSRKEDKPRDGEKQRNPGSTSPGGTEPGASSLLKQFEFSVAYNQDGHTNTPHLLTEMYTKEQQRVKILLC